VESLVESAYTSRPHCQRHFDLLGFAVYQHKPDSNTGNVDVAADIGIWMCSHVPGLHHYSSPPDWLYNHLSLGSGMLAVALRLHWLCAYSLILNGMVYLAGLFMGGLGAPCCPAGPICLTRSGCFDTTSAFPLQS